MRPSIPRVSVFVVAVSLLASISSAQLNENCTVSVLNRSIQAQADGSWVLPNVPSNVGLVRARATCIENGVTRSGQSDYFLITTNGVVTVPEIRFDAPAPIPASLTVTAPSPTLGAAGATVQLTVVGVLSDNRAVDLTGADKGTNYFTSNARVATVDANGLVTGAASGTTLVSAMNEGAIGMVLISV